MSSVSLSAAAAHFATVEGLFREFVASLKGTPHYATAVGLITMMTEGREMLCARTDNSSQAAPVASPEVPKPALVVTAASAKPAAPATVQAPASTPERIPLGTGYKALMGMGAERVNAECAARGIAVEGWTKRCAALAKALSKPADAAQKISSPAPSPAAVPAPPPAPIVVPSKPKAEPKPATVQAVKVEPMPSAAQTTKAPTKGRVALQAMAASLGVDTAGSDLELIGKVNVALKAAGSRLFIGVQPK